MTKPAATAPDAASFSALVSRAPMRAFQWITVAVCMLVLVSDGVDMQLLGILAPLVIRDFGVDRGTFGVAMSAALVGFGLGAWGGGRLGDMIGRRYALALATLVFAGATIAASRAEGVWSLALWRACGGLGFGAAYSNALAMASEWLPERLRPVALSTLSVGTPLGGTVAGWIGPRLAESYGWRGAFATFGIATLVLVVVVLAALRDSPSFLLARGKVDQAARAARRVLDEPVELAAEDGGGGPRIGVLDRTNLRLNLGIGMAFAASALVAYGILNWSTTFLTAAGFTLAQAGHTVSVAGITSMVGSISAGLLTRRYGSRQVMGSVGALLVVLVVALAFAVGTLPPMPPVGARSLIVCLLGATAATFSAAISTFYVVMALGYPPACRSAGIGFGIFMSRLGAVAASGFGGTLLDLGRGSATPFFAVLTVSACFILVATLIIDRHVPPMRP